MDVQNISEIVVTLAVAVIGVVTPYLAKLIKSSKTASTLVDVLPTLAKDAVVALQKLGVTSYIDGEVKKSKAVQLVSESLKNLGFTKVEADTIKNAVETAYATLTTDGILDAYTQAEPTTTTTTTEVPTTTTTTTESSIVTTGTLTEAQVKDIVKNVLKESSSTPEATTSASQVSSEVATESATPASQA